MHFEERLRGLLLKAFCSKGEGSSGCKQGGGIKGRVSFLKNEVNTAGVPLNKNKHRADSYVMFFIH